MKASGKKQSEAGLVCDSAIIEKYFERDESAILDTDRKYGRYLFAVGMNILRCKEDSEECLNDTYRKTWNAIPPARPENLRAFLLRIMRNTSFDRYERLKSQSRIPNELCESFYELDGALADIPDYGEGELGALIDEYLASSSDRKNYIFVARYYYARSIAEIARGLGCSISTVNKELSVIRDELWQRLNGGK